MKAPSPYPVASLYAVVLLCGTRVSVVAELKTFTLDPTQSSLSVIGSFAGISLGEQGPGSLTTQYGGFIEADVTAATIQFPGGSSIVASNSGDWQPGPGGLPGSAPANYGGQGGNLLFSGKAAIRNVVIDITSGLIPLGAGEFPALGLDIGFPTNANSAVDYTYSTLLGGGDSASQPLAGQATNNVLASAVLTNAADELVMVIPINYSGYATVLTTNDVQFQFTGQFVARAPAATGLEIDTIEITTGQLGFTIHTLVGHSYAILGSTNLIHWNITNDQFVATEPITSRTFPLPDLPGMFFRLRQDN